MSQSRSAVELNVGIDGDRVLLAIRGHEKDGRAVEEDFRFDARVATELSCRLADAAVTIRRRQAAPQQKERT